MSQLHPECVNLSIATNLVDSDLIYLEKSKAIYGQDELYARKVVADLNILAGQKNHNTNTTIQSKAGP